MARLSWTSPSAAVVMFLVGLAGGPAAAQDRGPVYVVPGRPDVPVMINGRDARWAVVEGDWGLARPGWVAPTVIKPLCCGPGWIGGHYAPHYFPSTGRVPGYGRVERDPEAKLPPRMAEPYFREWGVASPNLAPTIMPPAYDVPPVVVAPNVRRRW